MSNIKVIDINEETVETKQEAIEEPQVIEEAKEEVVEHEVSCSIHEPTNEAVDNTPVEETKEELKEEVKATKTDKQVQCPKCSKFMSLKNFRYRHEKLCTTEPKPVKPQAKPKGKAMPKPKVQPVMQTVQRAVVQSTSAQNQIIQPRNPLTDMAHHYQLLQQQFVQQKKEKYNVLCQNMFVSRSKKR